MKLEDMSNEQIDKLLFNLLNGYPLNYNAPIYTKFCSSWNATMPMAVEYGISSIKSHGEWEAYGWVYGSKLAEPRVSAKGDDRLRAIVICLIKVLEAKNGQDV